MSNTKTAFAYSDNETGINVRTVSNDEHNPKSTALMMLAGYLDHYDIKNYSQKTAHVESKFEELLGDKGRIIEVEVTAK